MRGIVQLEVLKAIQEKLPPRIPVRNFFDLIVGTRFVHGTYFLAPVNIESMSQLFYV